jgi:hypothetical protein
MRGLSERREVGAKEAVEQQERLRCWVGKTGGERQVRARSSPLHCDRVATSMEPFRSALSDPAPSTLAFFCRKPVGKGKETDNM